MFPITPVVGREKFIEESVVFNAVILLEQFKDTVNPTQGISEMSISFVSLQVAPCAATIEIQRIKINAGSNLCFIVLLKDKVT